jgi:hypothetical protein
MYSLALYIEIDPGEECILEQRLYQWILLGYMIELDLQNQAHLAHSLVEIRIGKGFVFQCYDDSHLRKRLVEAVLSEYMDVINT